MPDGLSLLGFVASSLVVLIIPGPAVIYVVARSLGQGRRAGLVSVLGLSAGALVHVAGATLGLSAILLASATAFELVRTLGVAYLIFLGLRALRLRNEAQENSVISQRSMVRLFREGLLISVLNPKIAVFFLAFLPQFVSAGRGPIQQQILLLGLIYVLLTLISDGSYALLASRFRPWCKKILIRRRIARYAGGAIYIGLGVALALTDRR